MMAVYSMPHIPAIQLKESELREPFKLLFDEEHLGQYPLASGIFAADLLDKMLQKIAGLQLSSHLSLKDAALSIKTE